MRIKLFCSGGFSTSILVKRVEEAAKSKQMNITINAYSVGKLSSEIKNCDVVLLGPQIGYTLEKVKKICDNYNVSFSIIPSIDYGMMNGEKVLELAISLLNK